MNPIIIEIRSDGTAGSAGVVTTGAGVYVPGEPTIIAALTRMGRNRAAAKARDNSNFMVGGSQGLLFVPSKM